MPIARSGGSAQVTGCGAIRPCRAYSRGLASRLSVLKDAARVVYLAARRL